MREKAIFSVFGRKLPSGKRVYYYHCYDKKGMRQRAKSTGLTKKTEAVAYCTKLFRDGLLIPKPKVPTFAEFSNGWWDIETSHYLQWRQLHEPMARTTIRLHKLNFDNHIKSYFAKYQLDEITPAEIEGWLLAMSKKKTKLKNGDEKGLNTNTINLVFATFKLMMKEAVRLKLLKENPCGEVKDLKEEEAKREILTVGEARKLFPPDWSAVWDSKTIYTAHRLAACTGLRIGELRGLLGGYVYDDYIFITGQYCRYGYVANTKTKQSRNVPITPLMRQELEELLAANGDGFVFSEDGGKTPVAENLIRRQFERALGRTGISPAERRKRNLTFHAWRHFFNTLLRMSNVADSKVQPVIGHRTKQMTDLYTHFDTRKFSEIRDVQAGLLAFKEPETEQAAIEKNTTA
jgi:integrase